MSKTTWITLAGPLTVLVGSMWVAAAIGDLAFRFGLAGDEAFLGLISTPLFLSFIPMLFALIATRLCIRQSAGALGRLGPALSVAGCAGVIISLLANILSSVPATSRT